MEIDDAENGAPAPHADVMVVGSGLADERAVKVVSPHRGKGAHVSRHARHEPGNEGGNPESQQAGATIARQHQRQDLVVTVLAGRHGSFPEPA